MARLWKRTLGSVKLAQKIIHSFLHKLSEIKNKAVEKSIITKVEPQDDETNTGEDNSSIKESSNNEVNPDPANEGIDLANAAQTSTPDQGRLRPNSQANTSLEDSQALSSENLERKILEAIGNYFFFNIVVTYNNKGKT